MQGKERKRWAKVGGRKRKRKKKSNGRKGKSWERKENEEKGKKSTS